MHNSLLLMQAIFMHGVFRDIAFNNHNITYSTVQFDIVSVLHFTVYLRKIPYSDIQYRTKAYLKRTQSLLKAHNSKTCVPA